MAIDSHHAWSAVNPLPGHACIIGQQSAIMHSAQLCAFGTFQRQRSLAGSGREAFHAAHNFRAFGKSGRAFLAVHWQGVKASVKCRARARIFIAQAHSTSWPVIFLPPEPTRCGYTPKSMQSSGNMAQRATRNYAQNAAAPYHSKSVSVGLPPHRASLLFITAHCA